MEYFHLDLPMGLHQGLSQDFKTARPNPAMIPKQPVQPVLVISIHIAREPRSNTVLREKKEYSTMEAPLVGDNCPYGL